MGLNLGLVLSSCVITEFCPGFFRATVLPQDPCVPVDLEEKP
jgi:hypothetical protein